MQTASHTQRNILCCNSSRLFILSLAWNIILMFMLNANTNHFNYIQKFITINNNTLSDTGIVTNKTKSQCRNLTKIIYRQTNATGTTKKEIKHQDQNDSQWYYDLIPPSIRTQFPITVSARPTRGEFNITETMLRQSRPIVGNTLRLHEILKSVIYNDKCLTIVTIGSSVTRGTNVGGLGGAYGLKFEQWLNAKYPNCQLQSDDNINKHQVIPYTAGGSNIVTVVENFEGLLEFTNNGDVDIIIIEYNVNDNFMGKWGNTLSRLSKKDIDPTNNEMATKSRTINWYSELFIRRILSLNTRISLLFFDASFMDFYRALKGGYEDGKQVQWMRYPILSYYAIPTISSVVPLFNLYQYCKNKPISQDWRTHGANYTKFFAENMYGWWQIMTDACCHPFAYGHKYMALTLAYNFDKEVNWIKYHDSNLNYFEVQRNKFMPPLWRVSKDEYAMLTAKHITRIDISKKKPVENVDYFNNSGFSWYSDTVKQKYGLIATGQFSHITFKIETKIGLVTIGFLATYEKISNAVLWIDDKNNSDADCAPWKHLANGTWVWQNYFKMTKSLVQDKLLEMNVINPLLDDRVSVYNAKTYLVTTPGTHFLHLVVVPQFGNNFCCKFKLLFIGSS